MAQTQLLTVSNKHEAIIEYLIINPTMKKGDVARVFGVSQTWLSIIMHSDAFKARLKARQDEHFIAATAGIKEKLTVLAEGALDTLIDRMELEVETSEVREMARLALDRLGYAPEKGASGAPLNQQNIYMGVDPEMLAAARQRIFERTRNNFEQLPSPAPAEEVSSSGGD